MNVRLLKDLLRIPSCSGREEMMIERLRQHFDGRHECHVVQDQVGNIFVTKGVAHDYPAVCAHTDTVHPLANVLIQEEAGRLFATDWTENRVGLGGDDKAGIFICLELVERFSVIKAAFFVGEEIGCHGARAAADEWFIDVGYLLEFDSPCEDILSFSSDGVQLFPVEGPFFDAAFPQLQRFGVNQWQRHPWTDVSFLKRRFSFPCLNLPAGYYRMHTNLEYVVPAVVENSISLGSALIEALGRTAYTFFDYDPVTPVKTPVEVTGLHTHDYSPPSTLSRPAVPAGFNDLVSRLMQLKGRE